ncbi:MAG TPA: peptide MFS transporter, partial [Gammaproteobacteria bacterium]|nr:peptide MFS transporter [Gammaproteobacteria bacterium]
EMWERFSYYGMRALLVLFMTEQIVNGGLGFSDATATAIYGLYTAAVYLVALPGGWIADRLWGAQRALYIGGVIIMAGHFVLAVPGTTAFFGGLILVVLGTGLLKPNISATVGELYAPGDPRRDGGFTIFYMGINMGAFLGPLVCGWLALRNWHYGFAAAGVGMLFGLIQFRATRVHLGDAGLHTEHPASPQYARKAWLIISAAVALFALAYVAGISGWIAYDAVGLSRIMAGSVVVALIAYFAYVFTFGHLSSEERNRIYVIIVLVIACALFWSGFEQAGSSLNLFAERFTVRDLGFFEIPATWFQSLNPIFIILLAPLYSMFWVALARRFLEPSAPAKFAIGLIIMGLGFIVMIPAAYLVADGQQVLPTWLFFTYLLHTMGELALSPVGLSSITKLAPKRFVGQMMGIWFMCSGLGNVIAGLIAGELTGDDLDAIPGVYMQIVGITVGCGVLLLLFSKPLKKLMGGAR